MNCLNEIAAEMKTFLERIPPQISYHIAKQGIYITGGSTRLPYIDKYLASYTGFTFNLSDFYETSAVTGLEKIIRNKELREWAVPVTQKTIIFRGASMKNLKKKVHFRIKLKSKHLLVIMSIFCVSCIAATFSSGVTTAPLQDAAGILIVPFENSINRISSVLKGMQDRMRDKEEILSENENLKAQIDSLTEQNNKLIQDQTEYVRLQQMYNLDQQYTEYPKIAAEIISKDPGNWYDTFMINRGSADGIRVDNNVLADKGLVGIVTEVGTHWATVRSIIDDSSNVSAMTVSTQDNCVVEGDLELIDEGKLSFSQLYDQNNKVTVGERIVTSNISEKYVEGLFIGYVSEVEQNSNNLTKTGTIVTPVDFQHLKNVLVITVNKQDSVNDNAQAAQEATANEE